MKALREGDHLRVLLLLVVSQLTVSAGCEDTMGPSTGTEVDVEVLGNGSGDGRVTAPDSAVDIDCVFVDGQPDSGSCDTEFFDAGAGGVFLLIAEPDPGSVFVSWSGCNTTNGNQCSLTFATGAGTVFLAPTVTFNLAADCVPAFTDLGGTAASPVIWEEKFSCVDNDGNCFGDGASDNNEPITFELVQDGKQLTGTVLVGQGEGDIFEGELCGNEFRWIDVTPGVVNPERGCWTFTSDSFNKRSGAPSEFSCVGIGTRGAGSVPPKVISCEELGVDTPSFSDCPAAPPAPPQDNPI